ncbi:MAG: carotenoid biosynthesis protein [bacterium]
MSYVHAMWVHRPYVVAFLVGFLVIALAERGVLGLLTWLALGTFVGWAAEASSIRTGFPFGMYSYHPQNFPDELWLAGIPLFASLSFAFLSYFAFTTARTLLGRIAGRGAGMRRVDDATLDRSPKVALVAAGITVWLDLVIDPISLLGSHWFLGDLYHYHSPALHFGVPLTNYLGWFVTCGVVAFANQALDGWLARRGLGPRPLFALPFQPLLGIMSCGGVFLFMIAITAHLVFASELPQEVPGGLLIVNGLALTALFAFACARALLPPARFDDAATPGAMEPLRGIDG